MKRMQHHDSSANHDSRWKLALLGFLAVAGFFLWTEHKAHLLGLVPYLLVLACPLLHLFHHRHRDGVHQHGSRAAAQASEPTRGAQS